MDTNTVTQNTVDLEMAGSAKPNINKVNKKVMIACSGTASIFWLNRKISSALNESATVLNESATVLNKSASVLNTSAEFHGEIQAEILDRSKQETDEQKKAEEQKSAAFLCSSAIF